MNVKRDLPPIGERLTISEVEELTGLQRSNIRYRMRLGRFPRPIKVDGHWPVFVRSEIEEYMAKREREAAKKVRASVRDAAYRGAGK